MRSTRHFDDVVDPCRVVATTSEDDHRRIEKLAHGAPALGAQNPLALQADRPASSTGSSAASRPS